MFSLLLLAAILAGGLVALRAWQGARLRRLSVERMGFQVEAAFLEEEEPFIETYPPRYHYLPVLAGLVAGLAIWFGTHLPSPYAIGVAVLVAAICHLLEMYWADRKVETIEAQLADVIDLMVASLRAGSALLAALEATLRESRMPMRAELERIVGRIRVGEDPRVVVRELSLRIPLESFRLFAHTLLVHWETGGSLASSLRTVGKTVRDRLEVARRINAQAVESQLSVVAVMLITYGLAVLTLNSNPIPFLKLIYSVIGSYIAAGLMILEAIGMLWIWYMSRIRF